MPSKKVIIIGAGIAGLSAAVRLAKQGYEVGVFEKHPASGGSAASFCESGFTFDIVPAFLIMPSFIREVFESAGEDIEKHLNLRRMPVHFKMFYSDGDCLTVYQDDQKNKEAFLRIEKNGVLEYEEFLSSISEIYEELKAWLYRSFTPRDILSPDFLRLIYMLRPFSNLFDYVSRYFSSDKLRWVFSFHAMFLGTNPIDAPASYVVLPYLEHTEYVYYPEGGVGRITSALEELALKFGVKFNFSSSIKKLVQSGNRVEAVILEHGETIKGDIFISNVDYPYTQEALLGRAEKRGFEYSFSAIQFFWGLNKRLSGLDHHNFFVSTDIQKTLNQLFNEGKIPDDPFVYVSLPSLTDSSLAPPDKDCMNVFIPVPALDKMPEIPHQKVKELRAWILEKLNKLANIDFSSLIEYEHRLLPEDYERRYNMKNGAIFGLIHSHSKSVFFRPPNFDAKLENLFYVGASVQPGNSLPLLIASGKIGADLVMKRREQDG